MDFDSPDVERDFPGLYASEGAEKSKKSKEESDFSEGDHDKISKKDLLIGRRRDKKEKSKDRGYAALEGESSPEEELDAKSPSKSKKTKTFKFTSSKSKEKREKSREKEKPEREFVKEEDKVKEKEKHKDEHKKKDKDRKEKDKKDKTRDKEKEKFKEKKERKTKQTSVASEEILELGDVQPVFGVSISLATERSRCHDGVDLPLVVRDCIDYLQEYALKSDQIYKVEPVKTRLQRYKRLYNNRERQPEEDELDIPTACGLLKLFLRELPEPVLTTDLIARFEEVASYPQVTKQQEELQELLELLPNCNKNLLSWILLHFDAVIQNERHNKMNAQSLAMLLSPPLQMSHRLLVALLCHCPNLFHDVTLIKYVPPITSSSPKLPDSPEGIQTELRKQESLLAQIHSEMNAGFVSKKREEQLWEVQRIITQLKRKLRSFEKKHEKSLDESLSVHSSDTTDSKQCNIKLQHLKSSYSEENTALEHADATTNPFPAVIPEENITKDSASDSAAATSPNPSDALSVDKNTGFLMLPKSHAEYAELIRLQLENQELLKWKSQLQSRIGAERAEILRLKQLYHQQVSTNASVKKSAVSEENEGDCDYERLIENYIYHNALLEHKKQMLAKDIFEERRECIALQVQLAMQKI